MRANCDLFAINERMIESDSRGAERHFLRMRKGNSNYNKFCYKRLNTGMAPICDWMIKIVKVNKLYLNSLLVSIVNRVSRSGTMKYQCENANVSNKREGRSILPSEVVQ